MRKRWKSTARFAVPNSFAVYLRKVWSTLIEQYPEGDIIKSASDGHERNDLILGFVILVLVYTLAIISRHDTPHQQHDGMREKGKLSTQNSNHDRTLRLVSFNIAEPVS